MIRVMQEADLEQVTELETACFSDPWSYNILKSGLHSSYDVYYVWEQDEKILGYCTLRILAGEGEIQRIAVLPQHRRLGLGRKLMEAMLNLSRENQVEAVSLEVRTGNTAARRLYESYGFAEEAVRKGYYHNPTEDAVIMWNRNLES